MISCPCELGAVPPPPVGRPDGSAPDHAGYDYPDWLSSSIDRIRRARQIAAGAAVAGIAVAVFAGSKLKR